MTKEELAEIPRRSVASLAALPPRQMIIAIETELNIEWWRGYHAGKTPPSSALQGEK